MPPRKAGKPVTAQEIALLKRWLGQGAPYAEHWAFVPPVQHRGIIAKHVGPKHPAQLATLAALERVYREQGKEVEADLLARQLAEAGIKSSPALQPR